MQVICLEEPAFYALVESVVSRLSNQNNSALDKWISGEEAMQKLRITSKTTLQNLRDTGSIRFSQPSSKYILYDNDSLNEYLEKHAKKNILK